MKNNKQSKTNNKQKVTEKAEDQSNTTACEAQAVFACITKTIEESVNGRIEKICSDIVRIHELCEANVISHEDARIARKTLVCSLIMLGVHISSFFKGR